MPPTYPLNQLPRGQCAVVCRLDTQGAMRRRLQDIGLRPGATVQTLFSSCCGDPVAYLISGAVIALRSCDAATVIVRPG